MSKIGLFLFLLFLATACQAQSMVESKAYNLMLKTLLAHTVEEISATAAYEKRNSVIFLDARALEEYEVSHIEQAIFVGYDHFEIATLDTLDRNEPIIVYCSVGYRSEKISEQLLEAGFKNIANLYGGIFEWKNRGYPVYQAGVVTENVHAFDKKWGIWLKKGNKVY